MGIGGTLEGAQGPTFKKYFVFLLVYKQSLYHLKLFIDIKSIAKLEFNTYVRGHAKTQKDILKNPNQLFTLSTVKYTVIQNMFEFEIQWIFREIYFPGQQKPTK